MIKLTSNMPKDEYTAIAYDAFDLQDDEDYSVQINDNIVLPTNWNIGLIYGASGSGKSTLLKEKFGYTDSEFVWDNSIAIISNFAKIGATPKEASMALCAVGLSTIPSWIRPYSALSTGEKARANLAISLLDFELNGNSEYLCYDEFTSTVNRQVAMSMATSVRKYIIKHNLKVIFASCHYDIIPALKPQWVFNPQDGETLYNVESVGNSRFSMAVARYNASCKSRRLEL